MFATAYGNVGSSIYYALGLVAAHALGLTPLVFLFAGGLFALTAKTYAEGASMFPEAGGSSSFARHAFDDVVSFFAGWALSLDYILTIAISAFFVPHYLSAFPGLGALKHNPDDIFGGLIVVAVLAWLNIRGLGESAKLNLVLAILDLSTQILLAFVGFALVLDPHLLVSQVHLGSVPTWKELIFALSLAMLAYTGIETVANMAEESKDPGRQVPKAVNLVVLAVLGGVRGHLGRGPVRAAGHTPRRRLQRELKQSFTLARLRDRARRLLRKRPDARRRRTSRPARHRAELARYYLGILAATILFIATNAGMIGISRLSWSLSEHRQLPRLFSQLHSRYRTPWFTLIFFSMLASTLIIYGNTEVLGNLYSFGAMLSFTTRMPRSSSCASATPTASARTDARGRAHQRRGDPDDGGDRRHRHRRRVGRGDGPAHRGEAHRHPVDGDRHGRLLLLPQTPGPGPAQVLPHARPERPADFEELEYKTALVPIFGDDVSASALNGAAQLIGEEGRRVRDLRAARPSQLSLEAGLEEEEAHGRSVLESARIQARRAGIKIQTGLIRTRNPGSALVEEAERVGSDVIYWSTIHAPAGEQRIGPTAAYLLSKRPCRVIIETENRPPRARGLLPA